MGPPNRLVLTAFNGGSVEAKEEKKKRYELASVIKQTSIY